MQNTNTNTNSTKIISLQFLHLLLSLSLYQIFDKILRKLNYLKWFASIHELRTSPKLCYSLLAWWKADKAAAGLQHLNLRLASDSRGQMSSEYGVLKTTNKEYIPYR